MNDFLNRAKRLVFVGGAPRSGTTLVQNMLDSHPNIFGGPELLHIPDVVDLRTKFKNSIEREWIDSYLSKEVLDERIASFIENILLPVADKHGAEFISEKTPQNVLAFSDLLELFPAAHFIQVIRDPRAIVCSMLQVGSRAKEKGIKTAGFTNDLNSAIHYTKKCIDAGFAACRIAPERIHTVIYEKLVKDPEKESRLICQFLGIKWSENMVNPGRYQHSGENAITKKSDFIWYDQASFRRDPDLKDVAKWQKFLSPRQQLAIARSFRGDENLLSLGYDFSPRGLSKFQCFLGYTLDFLNEARISTGRRLRSLVLRWT
jgi:hypothetical protein